ncbi:MAG: class I SAM-dependent methyltransferase [Alphaproteobacteria bacterium]|nr:class I SAM-dependent methyltransferase [Alphaproteobacteria bacterium]
MDRENLLQRLVKADRAPRPAGDGRFFYAVDRFSVFHGTVHLAGWAFVRGAAVASVEIEFASGRKHVLSSYGRPSPDVAAAIGAGAENVRFDEVIAVAEPLQDIPLARLIVSVAGEPPRIVSDFGMPGPEDHGVQIQDDYDNWLRSRPSGHLLEIGARARSGVSRKELVPSGWSYTGLDIVPGPNVDVVGDAHRLSTLFPAASFDAVSLFSVIEHLLMPWKVVIELNRVLKAGATGLVITHQCWPMHDRPADHWRFSDTAWPALFNRHTGFEIVRAALGSPAFVVPLRCNPFTNFGGPPESFLASSVLFRKTGETTLDWPVDAEEIGVAAYPRT